MESANQVPIGLSGYDAFDCPWVVPAPGLTGLAITSHRAYNIVKLISSAKLLLLSFQHRGVMGLIDLPARHERPGDPGHLVRHGDRRDPHWLAGQQGNEARVCRVRLVFRAADQ